MILRLSNEEVGLAMKGLARLKKSVSSQFIHIEEMEDSEDKEDALEALGATTHQIEALLHKLSQAGLNQDTLD